MARKTGQYYQTSIAGEIIEAFVPFPLPPANPELDIDNLTEEILAQAEKKLSELQLASSLIPSLEWFIYAYVRKEAVTSSQIEGTQATLIDLLSFESENSNQKSGNPNIEEICNYLDAIQYARGQLNSKKGLPLSMRLLNETHKRLMKGVRGNNKQPGEIRRSQNWIGGSKPSNATFVPPPPQQLAELLTNLEKYIHENDKTHPLIRIAMLHVQFETIHPYLDGNGRIGRLLITLLLEHWGLLKAPLLYLSLFFKRNRDEYYQRLSEVRLQGDWESWIRFFLSGISEISHDAIQLAQHLSEIVREDREKILAEESSTLFTLRLFELLPLHPIITMPQVVKLMETSKPTALKAIGTLEKLGILVEETGRKRDRIFKYDDYLGKLKFGTELKMYRIVLNYAFEDFVIKDQRIEYAQKAKYDFFFESEPEAEKYYHKVVKKLQGTPSIREARLEIFDSLFNYWNRRQESLIWSENNESDVTTFHASDVVTDRLQSIKTLIKSAGL